MLESDIERLPRVSTNIPSHKLKGLRIERLLELASRPRLIRMLEVGSLRHRSFYIGAMWFTLRIKQPDLTNTWLLRSISEIMPLSLWWFITALIYCFEFMRA
jgi:hypothetical protein